MHKLGSLVKGFVLSILYQPTESQTHLCIVYTKSAVFYPQNVLMLE